MAINLYDRPVSGEYFQLPYDELLKTGALIQGQEDQAKASLLDIGNKQSGALSKDQELLYKAQKDINDRTEGLYQKYKGQGLRNASDDIHKMRRELQQRESQMGDLGAMKASLDNHKAYMEDLNQRYEKGDISQAKRDKLAEISMNEYKGIGQPDAFGRYNSFKGITAAKDVEIAKQADELAKGWKETKKHNEGWTDHSSGGLYRKNGNTEEYISEKEVYNNILPQLKADPKNRAYAEQEAMLNTYGQQRLVGVDEKGNQIEYNPNDPKAVATHKENMIEDIFRKPAMYAANKYGFRSTSTESDIRNDEVAQHAAKKKIDDAKPALTSNIERAGFVSQFKSPKDIQSKVQGIGAQNEQIVSKASEFRDAKGNKVLFDSQVKMLNMMGSGKAAFDITSFHASDEQKDVILKYMSEINQNNKIKAATEQYDQRAKTEAGLDKNYKPDAALVANTEDAIVNSYMKASSFGEAAINALHKQGIKNPTIEKVRETALQMIDNYSFSSGSIAGKQESIKNLEQMVERSKDEFNDHLAKADPRYKKYNEILKRNAENNTETLGITSFTDKTVEGELAAILQRDLNENGGLGAKDLKTGQDLKDYSKIGKISGDGVGYYYEGDVLHLVSRPNEAGSEDKDGKKLDYIDVIAPRGTEQYVLQSKNVTDRQVAANNVLKQAETSPNFTEQLLIQDEAVTVRKLSNEDLAKAPAGSQYELRLGNTVKYYSKDGAIKALVNLTE